jgi:hypothetical protein
MMNILILRNKDNIEQIFQHIKHKIGMPKLLQLMHLPENYFIIKLYTEAYSYLMIPLSAHQTSMNQTNLLELLKYP